ncbi:MAG TPA: lamin tail domain-containing protein [Verrucomicrobiae bacterium]|nr:lamin tail domain-containing protein [Verrucomicrobiae bacterium]
MFRFSGSRPWSFLHLIALVAAFMLPREAVRAAEPPGPSSRRTALVITEIMYHPHVSWTGGDDLEFIELRNTGVITEDLTGHKIEGEISYSFPAGTQITPGQILVIARNPAAAQSFYGVSCLGPFSQRLNNAGGEIILLNELGGRLLEINYSSTSPWPAAADGAGHSLVLSHPSYGENDPRAWSASAVIGGSPGSLDVAVADPAGAIVINEYLAHTDLPQRDYIELFNTSTQPVNVSGLWLSDDVDTNKFRIPNGTMIPAGGFLAFTDAQLGFSLSSAGETILLVNSNRTRVLDAVTFGGQENGVPTGRHPDGSPYFQRLAGQTVGTPNAAPNISSVRINEIMYHPISELDDDEYLELHNRSGAPVSLAGWQIQDGIQFTFPLGAVIVAGGFVVVAKNAAHLMAKYPQLHAANTFGNYSGSLRNSGERIALVMPDDVVADGVTTIIQITMDEVTYADGGRWGRWSDGGGSSLELIDPRADNRLAYNWADSEESTKSTWTSIDVTDVLQNGQSFSHEGPSDYGVANRFEMFLQDHGEALVDNVEVRNNGGANLISNGDFNSGLGWIFGGVTRKSFIEAGTGIGGSSGLHLISAARGDTGPNKVLRGLSQTMSVGGANTGTIRAQVRWLKGSPYVLLRVRGNWMEVSRRLDIPANLGTPGLVNSRRVANAAPALFDVSHSPVLPALNQAVVVSARVIDPDTIGSVSLNYRLDPSATVATVQMRDNGMGGDAVAGDGLYSATIPGQPANRLAAFHISAADGAGASSLFPAGYPERECHVRWGEAVQTGSFGAYRLWVTSNNIAFWASREKNANDTIDATFVYNNIRAVYNVDTMYSGSPFHSPQYDSPLGFACDYEVNFPPDQRFLGSEPFVLTAYDVVSGNFFFNDDSGQVDITGNWIARKLGQPYNHRRHVHMFVNGQRRGTIYDDTQQPNSELIGEYFPDDEAGQLRKIESWFEFANNGQDQGSIYATLNRVNKSNGEIDTKFYRWNWRPRATANPNDWTPFTNLVAAVNNTGAANYEALVRTWMDVPNFLRPVITHHICGSWDSYAYARGKNMFAYKPDNAGWRLMMWDIEIALGAGGNAPNDSIYTIFDTSLRQMILNYPVFHREYLRGFQEAVDGPLMPGVADVALDQRYAAFQQNGIPMTSPQFIKNFINQRRSYLQSILPNVAFSVAGPAYQVIAGSNMMTLMGTAPLAAEFININGIAYPIRWTTISNWSVVMPLLSGTNALSISASNRKGEPLPTAVGSKVVNYTGVDVDPSGKVVFNEIMHDPAAPGAAYVELFNTHSNFAFDVSGWNVNGLGYTFPPGSFIPPRGFVVLAENLAVFNQTYGPNAIAFDQYSGVLDHDGETLTLQRPDLGTNWVVVNRVRFENVPPWPIVTNGFSLQLLDTAQDNSRVGNWSVGHSNFVSQPPASIVFLDYTNAWRFMQVSNLDGVNWTANGYNDANWPAGGGLLAFENNAVIGPLTRTVLRDPRLPINNVGSGHAYYFRTAFNLTNNLQGYRLRVSAYVDDGMVLYINGGEVNPRVRMNPGTVINSTLASGTPGSGDATAPTILTLPASLLVPGMNYIAAEVHQAAPDSTDVVFGVKLEAEYTNIVSLAQAAASPGVPNVIARTLAPFPPVWLNEVQPENLTGPVDNFSQRDSWVEIHHSAPTNFSLAGYYLSDSHTNLTRWVFPANATLGAGGFNLVWCDNQVNQNALNQWHAAFQLPARSGRVILSRAISNQVQVVDYLNYTNLTANWSFGDVPDAQPFYRRALFYPTPGVTNNGASAPLSVFINEWLADNSITLPDPADGQYEDWFEIYNPGEAAVNLGGYYLTDNLNNPLQFQIPNNGHYIVPAGGRLLVWADNESTQNSTNRVDLHADFALGKGGEALGLFAPDGTPIDVVVFGSQQTDVSQGRFPDGAASIYFMPAPTPRLPNVVPNSTPVLQFIPSRLVTLGYSLSFAVDASDSDLPAQALSFALLGGTADAEIGLQSGVFTWTPATAPATNTFQVVVTDNGTPSLSATQSFTVVVAPVPPLGGHSAVDGEYRFSWQTFAGQTYQLEYKDSLGDEEWIEIGAPILGTGVPLSFTNGIDESLHGFFRLRILE